MKTPEQIAANLTVMEREWLIGWQGSKGAAYNVVATDLVKMGLLKGLLGRLDEPLDWQLSATGEAVRVIIKKQDSDYQASM
jgi:hypothetical protein